MSNLPVPAGGRGVPTLVLVEAVEAAAEFHRAAMANSTRRAYATDWVHFTAWCAGAGVDALPAVAATLAAYLAAMGRKRYAFATIERRRAAVTHYHREAGFASPSADPAVEKTMSGIARSIGTRQAQKAPITDVELRKILKRIPEDLRGLRDRALLLVAYAGALRRSELVSIELDMIERTTGGLIVHLGRTKANQEGADEIVGVPTGRVLKPVAALDAWLAAPGIAGGPVFRGIDRHGKVSAKALTPQSVNLIIKARCAAAGLDPALFAGHSLRAGLITAALGSGVDLFSVMEAARHADLRTTKKYDRRAKVLANHAGRKVI